jgi:hypothetical protein
MAEIDTLQVKITANAKSAADSLRSLASALGRVKTSLSGLRSGFDVADRLAKVNGGLTKSLGDINKALDGISVSGMAKLEELTKTINRYTEAIKNAKGVGSVNLSQKVKGLDSATAKGKSPAGKGWKSSVKEYEYTKKDFAILNETDVSEGTKKKIDATKELGNEAEKASSKVKKLGNETKTAGQKVKEATGFFGKFVKSIGRIMLYRAIRSALKGISEAFSEGLKNAYYFSKQTGDLSNLAKTLDGIASKTKQMTNQLGSFFGELKQTFKPILDAIMDKVIAVTNYLTELFAALNGDTVWKHALYVAESWDEAVDEVKEYKHQLLGLDELNNLSKKDDKKKDAVKAALDDFEYLDVSDKFRQIAWKWNGIKEKIKGYFGDWRLELGGALALAVLGTIFVMATGHWALGLGMIFAGGYFAGKKIAMHWNEIKDAIDGCMDEYRGLFALGSIGLTVLGAALLFTQHYALGIGCILGGVALGATAIAFSWEKMQSDIETAFQKFAPLFALGGLGSMVAGVLLLFTGHLPLGLAMLFFGGFLTASTIGFNWDSILEKLQEAWEGIRQWWNSTVVVGIKNALKWIEDKFGIDLGIDDKLPTNQKYESNLARSVRQGYIQLEPLIFGAEHPGLSSIPLSSPKNTSSKTNTKTLNGVNTSLLPSSDMVIIKPGSAADVIESSTKEAMSIVKSSPKNKSTTTHTSSSNSVSGLAESVRNGSIKLEPYIFGAEHPDLIKKKALGGVVGGGSLFYAGEAGAEFVGNIGSTSAVANTGQMTEAIYKAAYMGMSKALKENGGGGMSGFEPATTDDLFIAMRKKASNYNKMTGNPAFA